MLLSLDSSNLQVANHTTSLSGGDEVDVSKHASAVAWDTSRAAISENLQPSSNVSLLISCDATIASSDSPSREPLEPSEEARDPIHLDEDDSRGEDPTTPAFIINKGKTILIEDSKSSDNRQIAPMNVPADIDDALVL